MRGSKSKNNYAANDIIKCQMSCSARLPLLFSYPQFLLLCFFFFFVTGGGHTPRAFVPRSLSENIYLFTEPLSGDPLRFSGIHQSKCTCLSHTISLGQGIFRDIASAISSWLIASQIGNGKWMGFAIYLKTISSREFFISSFRLGGKTANSLSQSNSWNVTKDVHAVIEKSSFFRSCVHDQNVNGSIFQITI